MTARPRSRSTSLTRSIADAPHAEIPNPKEPQAHSPPLVVIPSSSTSPLAHTPSHTHSHHPFLPSSLIVHLTPAKHRAHRKSVGHREEAFPGSSSTTLSPPTDSIPDELSDEQRRHLMSLVRQSRRSRTHRRRSSKLILTLATPKNTPTNGLSASLAPDQCSLIHQLSSELHGEAHPAAAEDDDYPTDCSQSPLSPQCTPGNAGLGAEDEHGEIILIGIHERREIRERSNSSVTSESDISESESERTPTENLFEPWSISTSSTGESSICNTNRESEFDSQLNTSTRNEEGKTEAFEDLISPPNTSSRTETHTIESASTLGIDCSEQSPSVAAASTSSSFTSPPPSLFSGLHRPLLLRRATVAVVGGDSARSTSSTQQIAPPSSSSLPYDFNSAGSLLIDGWEIGRKGVTRTPVTSPRRLSLSNQQRPTQRDPLQREGTMSCEHSPAILTRNLRRNSEIGQSCISHPLTQHNLHKLNAAHSTLAESIAAMNIISSTPPVKMRRLHIDTERNDNKQKEQAAQDDEFALLAAYHAHRLPSPPPPAMPSALMCPTEFPTSSVALSPCLSSTLSTSSSSSAPSCTVSSPSHPAALGIELKLSDLVRLGPIGRGANGCVFKAIHLPSWRIVALKSVSIFEKNERHQLLTELKTFLEMERLENKNTPTTAAAAEQTDSTSIPPVHPSPLIEFIGACFSEGKITMALQYMNRGSLDQLISRLGAIRDERMLKRITRQLLQALRLLHEHSYLHRDIKPQNFLIRHSADACIADFGLMKHLDCDRTSGVVREDDKFVGSLLFLSPERMLGLRFSFASDIYALGLCVLFMALGHLDDHVPKDYWSLVQQASDTNEAEEDGLNLPDEEEVGADGQKRPKWSAQAREFVRAMLHKNPNKRMTAAQLLEHPWMKQDEEEEKKAVDEWKGAELQEPDADELHVLVDAVVSRWYTRSKLALSASYSSSSFSPSCWTPSSVDVSRFTYLSTQLGWRSESVIAAFRIKIQDKIHKIHSKIVKSESMETIMMQTMNSSGTHFARTTSPHSVSASPAFAEGDDNNHTLNASVSSSNFGLLLSPPLHHHHHSHRRRALNSRFSISFNPIRQINADEAINDDCKQQQ